MGRANDEDGRVDDASRHRSHTRRATAGAIRSRGSRRPAARASYCARLGHGDRVIRTGVLPLRRRVFGCCLSGGAFGHREASRYRCGCLPWIRNGLTGSREETGSRRAGRSRSSSVRLRRPRLGPVRRASGTPSSRRTAPPRRRPSRAAGQGGRGRRQVARSAPSSGSSRRRTGGA